MPHTERSIYYEVTDLRAPWVADDAPAVLFHHGIGINMDMWSQWLPIIAPHYRAIRFDMRGFGQSHPDVNVDDWTLDDLVADLWSVADAVGQESVHLVGESMGATVALAAALAKPSRVHSLRMLNGTFKGQGLGELPNWKAQFASGDSQGWSARMMGNRFHGHEVSQEAFDWFEAEQAKTDAAVAIALGSILAQTDLTPKLTELQVPVTMVLPDQSPFVPTEHGAAFLEHVPHADLQLVKGIKHGLPFVCAVEQAQSLLKTLDQTRKTTEVKA